MIVNIVSAGGLTQIAGPSAVTVMKNFKFGIFKLASLEVLLADWGRDEVNVILQTTISNAFSWMKIYWFRLTKTIPKGSITNIPAPVQTILWTNDDYFSDVYIRRSSSMSHPVNGLISKISKRTSSTELWYFLSFDCTVFWMNNRFTCGLRLHYCLSKTS